MKTKSLILSLLWLSASAAQARFGGPDLIGNGGDAVVCRSAEGAIVSAEVLDLYEARRIHDRNPNVDGDQSVEGVLAEIRSNLDAHETLLNETLKAYSDSFIDESLFLDDVELTDINDSDHIIVPNGCKVEQVVIQNTPDEFNPKRYTVNNEIWSSFDNLNKAAMILHESLYRIFLDNRRANDSKIVRLLLSYLISDALNTDFHKAFDLIQRIGLEEYRLTSLPGLKLSTMFFKENGEVSLYTGTVETTDYVFDNFGYSLPVPAGSTLSYSKNDRKYSLAFFQTEGAPENMIELKVGRNNSVSVDMSKLDSLSLRQIAPQTVEQDDGDAETVFQATELELRLSNTSSPEDEEVVLAEGTGVFNGELFNFKKDLNLVHEIKSDKVLQVSSQQDLKQEKLGACKVVLKPETGFLCVVRRPKDEYDRNFLLQVKSYDESFRKDFAYTRVFNGRSHRKDGVWVKKSYHKTGFLKSYARKVVEYEAESFGLRTYNGLANLILDRDSLEVSLKTITSDFEEGAYAESYSRSPEIKFGFKTLENELGIEGRRFVRDNYPEAFQPAQTTYNRSYYANGNPKFNTGTFGETLSGFVLNGGVEQPYAVKIVESGEVFKDFEGHTEIYGYQAVVLPYPEFFSNGQVKYAMVSESVSVEPLSNLYLKNEGGDLVRVTQYDLVELNERGEAVNIYQMDSFFGAYQAVKIRERQVEEYGFK